MNKLRKAAKMALEALENHSGNYKLSKAECVQHNAVVDALRQALNDAAIDTPSTCVDENEKREHEPFGYVYQINGTHTEFSKELPPDDAYDEGTLVPVFTAPQEPWDTSDMAYRPNGLSMDQEPVEPPSNKYNSKRIAWELERTAMGDGYYGNALYVAMDMPQTTRADREMLNRYMHGSNLKTDHVKLQDLAMRIYTAPPSKQEQEPWDTSDMAHRANGLSMEQEANEWYEKALWGEKQEPVAYITGEYKGYFTIEQTNKSFVLTQGMNLYTASQIKPEQEPVLWKWSGDGWSYDKPMFPATPLYSAPPSKPWVALSDGEILDAAGIDAADTWVYDFAYAIEDKLKELNHG